MNAFHHLRNSFCILFPFPLSARNNLFYPDTPAYKSMFKQKQRIVLLYTILCFLFHQSTVTIGLILVEMRGVEPLSENIAIQLSPSADVILYFALRLPDDGPSHCYPKEFPLKPIGISLKVSHY